MHHTFVCMKSKMSISFRALFLLIVFLLNTAIGFACALTSGLLITPAHHSHDKHASHHGHHAPVKPSHHCCGDDMVSFALLDKTKSWNDDHTWIPLPVTLLPVKWLTVPSASWSAISHRYVILHQYPPPKDIRIAIQSFLI